MTQQETIVLAYDGSEEARPAISVAARTAARRDRAIRARCLAHRGRRAHALAAMWTAAAAPSTPARDGDPRKILSHRTKDTVP
jgi:nucleotide-binding universal stress UspA family protein